MAYTAPTDGRCPNCGPVRTAGSTVCPRCASTLGTAHHPGAPPAPAASPVLLTPVILATPQHAGGQNFWRAIAALQRTLLLIILAAAVYLLYRYETRAEPLLESAVQEASTGNNSATESPIPGSPYRNATIGLNPAQIRIEAGAAWVIHPFGSVPGGGWSILPSGVLNWSSSNPEIAAVNLTGTVTGMTPGNAIITVRFRDGHASATAPVTVTNPSVDSIPTGAAVHWLTVTEIPLGDSSYRYMLVPPRSNAEYAEATVADDQFRPGAGAFGTPGLRPPLSDAAGTRTVWPSGSALLARRDFELPTGARAVTIRIIDDAAAQVFINGRSLNTPSDALNPADVAESRWFTVPDSMVHAGWNRVSVHVEPRNDQPYFDMQLTAMLPSPQ